VGAERATRREGVVPTVASRLWKSSLASDPLAFSTAVMAAFRGEQASRCYESPLQTLDVSLG